MFPSRYPGVCIVCGVHFPASDLLCFRAEGTWRTVCLPHKEEAAGKPAIVCKVEGDRVIVEAKNLDQAAFNRFLPLARSGVYDPARRVNTFPASGAFVEVLRALKEADLPLVLDPTVKALLNAAEADEKRALAALDSTPLPLFPFQKVGAAWLRSRTRAILADDMGLGKTVQALLAVEGAPPLLILCPAVAKGVWTREIGKWRPGNWEVAPLSGRGAFRWPDLGEAVIINYDILSDVEQLAHPNTVIICDEAHVLKEAKTNRHKRVVKLAAQAARLYLLTATPLLNRPQELWNLLKLADLHTEAYGTWGGFCYAFDGSPSAGWGTPRQGAAIGFSKVALRRNKTEVLKDLPAKRRAFIPVATTYTRSEQAILDEADEAVLKHGKDVPFELISKARAITAKAKIGALVARVEEYEEAGEPLIVFSYHRAPIDVLAAREGWATITGDTSNEERTKIEAAFQAGEYKGVAATIQAGGVAITLTRASNVLFCDRAWTPALNEQAEDRCNRIGQTRGVLVEVLVAAKTIDERVEEIIEEKCAIIRESVDKATIVRVDASLFNDLPEVEEGPVPAPLPTTTPKLNHAPQVSETTGVSAPWEDSCPF